MKQSTFAEQYKIDFEPVGKRVLLTSDKTIMDGTLLSNLDLVTSCNGLGACGSCKIQRIAGDLTPITAAERNRLSDQEIKEGFRLACQAKPLSDLRIYIPTSSLIHGQQLQIDGVQNSFVFDPVVKTCDIFISKFGPHDTLSDWERIQKECLAKGIKLEEIAFSTLQNMSQTLRDNHWEVRVVYKKNKVIQLLPTKSPIYGIALDIGSTKIAAYWVDMQNGSILYQAGFMNPQISLGEDVVNRIAYANQSQNHQDQLQNKLIQSINDHTQEICKKLRIEKEQIVDMVVVGNSVIHHLFCGISVRSLGEAPYTPVFKEPIEVKATDLKLDISPGAEIYLPPLIAGYVGADHTAALIATRFRNMSETTCLIDVGTNTEISLIHNQKIYSCSCASGPAFEGAHIHDGMRAAPGAIDQVKIINNEIQFSTIMQKEPVGICGSGILSAIAEMSRNKIIDHRGVFQKDHVLTVTENGQKYIVLAERVQEGIKHSIRVNRHDVNEIQLAKGAIRTGIEILCIEAGIMPDLISKFLVAGAFGNHLDLQSAVEIGMFPNLPLDRFSQIGNAAGVGSREMLMDQTQRQESQNVVSKINYIELTSQACFKEIYVAALSLEKNDQLSKKI